MDTPLDTDVTPAINRALGTPARIRPGTHTGIIAALSVPADVGLHLAVPGGEEPDELHITLAFLGRSEDLKPDDVPRYRQFAAQLTALAARTPPLLLKITGADRFENANEGQDACYLDVDGPHLRGLREEVMQAAEAVGLSPSRKHPNFHPHITLVYCPAGSPHPDADPPPTSFRVPGLELWLGGQHHVYPFGVASAPVLAKADHLDGQPGLAQARTAYAQLTGDLIGLSRKDRQVRAQVSRLAEHHAQAAEGLGNAVRYERGSALEDAFLEHSGEARAARALSGL